MNDVICGDDRFKTIEKAKQDLLESTNIQTSEDEMQVIDDFLFRCWQMGWLEKYEQPKIDCSECTRRKFYQQGYQDGLNADKWIPCEERLPNKGDVVLAQYHGWNGFDKIVMAYIREDDEWKIEFGGVCNYSSIFAWQPLPQPYKKEGAE
jgi:hypothetical protein